MKIKQGIIVLLLSFLATTAFAQQREYSGFFDSYYYKGKRNLNFTANGGLAMGLTDLPGQPGPSFGIGAGYKLWPRVMFGAEFHYMMFSGTDNNAKRNLEYSAKNMELLGFGRLYLLDDVIRISRDRNKESRFLKIYFMSGLGFAMYNADVTYSQPVPVTDSSYVYDEPGSGKSLVIPAALGFSWRISNKLSLVTEVGYRYTFTDLLEGISDRANPKTKDGYMVFDLKVQFSPWMPSKKKSKSLAPPEKYEGPKGTETWKNRKKEEPVQKRNNYYEEEQPQEEQQYDENGNPIEPANKEENQENPDGTQEENQEEPKEEEAQPDGWN